MLLPGSSTSNCLPAAAWFPRQNKVPSNPPQLTTWHGLHTSKPLPTFPHNEALGAHTPPAISITEFTGCTWTHHEAAQTLYRTCWCRRDLKTEAAVTFIWRVGSGTVISGAQMTWSTRVYFRRKSSAGLVAFEECCPRSSLPSCSSFSPPPSFVDAIIVLIHFFPLPPLSQHSLSFQLFLPWDHWPPSLLRSSVFCPLELDVRPHHLHFFSDHTLISFLSWLTPPLVSLSPCSVAV